MPEILSTWILPPVFALVCLSWGMQLTSLFYRCPVKYRKLFVLPGGFLTAIGRWLYRPPSADSKKSGQSEECGHHGPSGCSKSVLGVSRHSFADFGVSGISSVNQALAGNVHDTWARARIDGGWSYGPARDDHAKTHPCLVPCAKLPDSEREYDRHTAFSTLELVCKFGYGIVKTTQTGGISA